MVKVAINGRFLTRPTTGVDRYAREVMAELDRLLEPGEAVMVVPEGGEFLDAPCYENIEIVAYGKRSGHAWEQLDFAGYVRRNKALGLNLCNTAPLINPGIVCIHDMAVRANESNFSKAFVLWYRLMFAAFARRAKAVVTVSEFSRREIAKYYPGMAGKTFVVGNAWQHIERVESDAGIFTRHSELAPGGYWFAMSSLAPNKNLKWLVETALANPTETIAIAGGLNTKVFGEHGIPEAPNVVYLGYVSDAEAKALMQGCKGFLYPTFYEGFGIPPMEAMACGAPAAVSDTEVMHEVYGESVRYVDPHVPCGDLSNLLGGGTSKSAMESCLSRYSWRVSAEKLYGLLEDLG